jgi:hypothetical protein
MTGEQLVARCPTCSAPQGNRRATVEELEALHGLLAEIMLSELRKQQDKTGGRNGSSRLMSVILSFLKDNGVTSPAPSQRAVDALVAEMPDFDELQALHE